MILVNMLVNLHHAVFSILARWADSWLLGLAARIGRFCTLGAIEDYLHGDSHTRLRMWGLAISL